MAVSDDARFGAGLMADAAMPLPGWVSWLVRRWSRPVAVPGFERLSGPGFGELEPGLAAEGARLGG